MLLLAAGCDGRPATTGVPAPVNLLLPHQIRLHPFTGTRTFDQAGGVKGVEVRVEATNAFGDSTLAFGDFRFELYQFRATSPDPKGALLHHWELSLQDVDANMLHWDRITRSYVFKLQWTKPIPVGQRFVMAVSFASPHTERLYAEHVFISGQ
jgi:hypothetical protein